MTARVAVRGRARWYHDAPIMPRRCFPLLFLLAFSAAFGQAPPDTGEPWTVVHEVDGIKVFQRVSPNPDLREYKAIGLFDLPAPQLASVLKDRPKYTEFFPYLVENRQFVKADHHYSYERISAPFVSERDYTVEHVDEDLEGGGFRINFHDANEEGPIATPDKVRVQVVRGMWEVLAKGESRSQITYHVYTDPGGAIPNFIINAANKKGVSRAMLALVERARSLGKVNGSAR